MIGKLVRQALSNSQMCPCSCGLVTDRTFGLAELFGRTSTVWFGPNERTFSAEHKNFFLLFIAFFKMATLKISSLAYVNNVIMCPCS